LKRAQITLFLIIAAVFAIGAGIYLFIASQGEEIPEAEVIASQVPQELNPIKEYVDACIDEVSHDAISKLGLHGGYIDPSSTDYYALEFYYDILDPTESDAVLLNVNDPRTAIPYWWYLVSKNDCYGCTVTAKNVPSFSQMETQINNYVNKHLNDCLDDFSGFEGTGFRVKAIGDIETETTITEQEVTVHVTYPLQVSIGERVSEIETFFIRQPVRLREMFNLAREIVIGENQDAYLEFFIEQFITAYSGFDTKRLPPHSASEEGFSKKIWIKQDVKKKIKEILRLYVPVFQVNGTRGAERIVVDSPYEQAAYDTLNLDVLINEYPDFEVSFIFMNWPIYVDVTPNQGEVLTVTETIHKDIPLLGPKERQIYEFFYDVSFPVIVQIRSRDEFNKKGYTFMFAMEGNLRDDKNIRDFATGRGTIGPSVPLFMPVADEEAIPDDFPEFPGVPGVPEQNTVFCNYNQRIGSPIDINVFDEEGSPIQNARVRFGCGYHATCGLGSAEFDPVRNVSEFKSTLPICFNGGHLTIAAKGYKSQTVPKLTSLPDRNISMNFTLQKYVVLNVSVKKLQLSRNVIYRDPLEDYEGNYATTLTPGGLTDEDVDDQIIIRIMPVGEEGEILDDPQLVIINNVDPVPLLEQIKVLPGIYDVSAQYFDPNPVIIPPEFRCYNGDCDDAGVWIPDKPGVEIETMFAGGVELNNETGYWEVTDSELDGATEVFFTILSLPIPLIVEDLSDIGQIESQSAVNRIKLEPELR
jgi:hypothetical protein